MTRIDIIVAVRNEEQSIPVFLRDVAMLSLPANVDLKVMFVEDSSTDGTRPLLRRLAEESPMVSYYTLVQGFGQGAAVTFGLSRSTADAMIMMDVDGSHPIDVIPEMIRRFLGGAQVVQCVRRSLSNRQPYRRIGAALYHGGARLLTGSDPREQNIFYRLISADVARFILAHPRYWRYLRFPLPRRPPGASQFLEVDAHERVLGESKYHFRRLVNLAVDGVLSQIPGVRFGVLLAAGAAISAALVAIGVWPLGLVVGVTMLWVVLRYRAVRRPDLLQRVEVLESGSGSDIKAASR